MIHFFHVPKPSHVKVFVFILRNTAYIFASFHLTQSYFRLCLTFYELLVTAFLFSFCHFLVVSTVDQFKAWCSRHEFCLFFLQDDVLSIKYCITETRQITVHRLFI